MVKSRMHEKFDRSPLSTGPEESEESPTKKGEGWNELQPKGEKDQKGFGEYVWRARPGKSGGLEDKREYAAVQDKKAERRGAGTPRRIQQKCNLSPSARATGKYCGEKSEIRKRGKKTTSIGEILQH